MYKFSHNKRLTVYIYIYFLSSGVYLLLLRIPSSPKISKYQTIYIYRLILARTGPEQYGLISLGIAILGVSTTVSLLGLNQGVIRYISFYKTKKELLKVKEVIFSAIKLTLPLSLVITILLVLFSKQISIEFFDNIDLDIVVKVVAIALPFSVLREIFFNTFISF